MHDRSSMANPDQFGTLYIVATPIGHLDDMSLRAINTLKKVTTILCEDTRHSGRLLQHIGVSKPLIAFNNTNEAQRAEKAINRLKAGDDLALISDAGTPLISDPGYPLVEEARTQLIPIVPIPGPSAVITALSASGLPTREFTFLGFLPQTQQKRLSALQALAHETRTLVFYESPHRIVDSLKDMEQVFGKTRKAVLAKELTKQFETFVSGPFSELLAFLNVDEKHQKGEFVLMIEGSEKAVQSDEVIRDCLSILLESGLSTKKAANACAKLIDCKKNQAYEIALQLKG